MLYEQAREPFFIWRTSFSPAGNKIKKGLLHIFCHLPLPFPNRMFLQTLLNALETQRGALLRGYRSTARQQPATQASKAPCAHVQDPHVDPHPPTGSVEKPFSMEGGPFWPPLLLKKNLPNLAALN